MNNPVKFLRGNFSDLPKVPLTPGSIYFTEDTRRLFIDTNSARLPVASDQVAGKIFWVRLPASGWINLKQTVSFYYNEKSTVSPMELSDLISEDSIMFLGKISYDTPNPDGISPAVVSSDVTNTSITFRCFNVDSASTKPPSVDMWVQIYCPNPKIESLVSVDVFRTVFTTRIRMKGNAWTLQNRQYIYDIVIPGIDFSVHPFIVNLSDDSLENRNEFQKIQMDNSGANLRFTSDVNIQFNIEVDICIWLGPGAIGGHIEDFNQTTATAVDWVVVTVNSTSSISNNKIVISNVGPFADLADPSKDRLFLSFCTENTNADYAKVEDITYSNKNLTFIFKDGTTRLDKGFTCVVIQLNNIAKIQEGTLEGRINQVSGDAPTYDGWTRVDSQMRYYITNNILPPEFVANRTTTFYSQFWPEPSQESNLLSGKYMPLVLPVNKADAGRFAKICETKMYSNRIQFFIKEKNLSSFASGNYHDETKDLKIMIIDFL